MTNEITISITASGKDALKILKALSTLDGVAVKTATKKKAPVKDKPIKAVEPKAAPKPAPVKGVGKGRKSRATGRFATTEELFDYFFDHSKAGTGRTLTVAQVAESAEVSIQIAYGWQRRTGNSFEKGHGGRKRKS